MVTAQEHCKQNMSGFMWTYIITCTVPHCLWSSSVAVTQLGMTNDSDVRGCSLSQGVFVLCARPVVPDLWLVSQLTYSVNEMTHCGSVNQEQHHLTVSKSGWLLRSVGSQRSVGVTVRNHFSHSCICDYRQEPVGSGCCNEGLFRGDKEVIRKYLSRTHFQD